MAFNSKIEDFAVYKITNGHFHEYDTATSKYKTAERLGCIGSLSVESEMITITKTCEGAVAKEKNFIQKLNVTASLHIVEDIRRRLMGLENTGLKAGVFGLSNQSVTKSGTLTFDALDMDGNKKLLAFPMTSSTAGFKFTATNGEEEIAETELEFSCVQDKNGFFFYEGLEDEITDTALKTAWHTSFDPGLAKDTGVGA